MRNDDENKNMIQATVEDGILHIHTPRKAGFIMENAKATGQKTFRSIEWRQRVKWKYRSSSFGGINWTMTLLKCIPFTELRSSDLVRRRRGEFAALSVWTFRYHPEQTVSWLYIWWSNNTSASLPEVWQHNPADFEDIQEGERTGLCLKAEIKNAAISNASSDNDKKRKEKMKRSHFIFITGRGQQGAARWPNEPSVLSELLVRPPKGILTFFDGWRDMRTQTDHYQYDRFLFTWSHTFV